ncbi:TetR/AcrR family transcriptional regulator [Burkholderia gladioli]|jgi:TetR/AcrR family transcriptional repressor of nem operon|uniref:TetR/AcrR family transcriptional regulator n=2 Tax=Burkholderia gladioli TaxID=28095 RepID=UPI001E58501C|nr:TetR/AcrR family transcriptional regulator [Burkholderia gladioli]
MTSLPARAPSQDLPDDASDWSIQETSAMTNKMCRTGETRQRILDAAKGLMASKGFSAVGLNEVLHAASVPKDSFYHYFASKDASGEALLDVYFEASLADMGCLLTAGDPGMGDRLVRYWQGWADRQMESNDGMKCVVVKLGAELADISESMRLALERGTDWLVERLAEAIRLGIKEFVNQKLVLVANAGA